MQLHILVTIIAFALSYFSQVGEAISAKSEVYDWHYELDAASPLVTTKDAIHEVGLNYHGTVRVERVNGTMMVIEHTKKKQVATLAGEAAKWADSVYPDINDPSYATWFDNANKAADFQAGNGTLHGYEHGDIEGSHLAPRNDCSWCFIAVGCSDKKDCDLNICVLIACY